MKVANWIENVCIAILVVVICFLAFNELKFKPVQKQLEKQIKEQSELIKQLSERETYKIENTFDKIKAKDGTINLDIKSELNKPDTSSHYEAGFFSRIFNWSRND